MFWRHFDFTPAFEHDVDCERCEHATYELEDVYNTQTRDAHPQT